MEQFIAEVEAYATAVGLEPSTVVQRAAGVSGAIWKRWKSGEASCTLTTADRVRAYMAANPPPEPNGAHPSGAAA